MRRRSEFLTVQQRGRRRTSHHFVLICETDHSGTSRLGITVSRKVGSAVVRNRVKRRVREYFRRRVRPWPGSRAVLIARVGAGELTHAAAARELEQLFCAAYPREQGRA